MSNIEEPLAVAPAPPRRRRLWAFAAAFVLGLATIPAVMVFAGWVTVANGDSTPAIPSTTSTTSTTSTSMSAGVRYHVAEVRDLGSGGVVGVSPDSGAALVVDDNPASRFKVCGGFPARYLYQVPLSGGPRQMATPASDRPIGSGPLVSQRAGAKVMAGEGCEESFDNFVTATMGPDGHLTDLHRVTPKGAQLSAFGLGWSADARSFIGVTQRSVAGGNDIVRVDAVTGDVTVITPKEWIRPDQPLIQAAELSDGTLVALPGKETSTRAASDEKLLLSRDSVDVRGQGFVVAPDGRSVAVYGQDGLFLVTPGRDPIRLVDGSVSDATWAPDGHALAYMVWNDGLGRGTIKVVTTDRTATVVVGDTQSNTGFFTPDGKALVFDGIDAKRNDRQLVRVARFDG
jgi:hypothetical protein